jgi:MoxR-like ATPase
LVRRTRESEEIEFGASPRASMALVLTAKARAFLQGRTHVASEDIEALAPAVLRHRIILDFRVEREGRTPDDVIESLFE